MSMTADSAGPTTGDFGPRLGIVGGGQLARMTAKAALRLGCDVIVLERSVDSPAAMLATHSLVGDWNTMPPLRALAAKSDVVTLENEFVDTDVLLQLEREGATVLPRPRTLQMIQDKLRQKETLAAAGLPVPRMRAVHTLADVADAAREFGLPMLLKARRDAYDGKGNATLHEPEDFAAAWRRLGGEVGRALFAEAFCPFERELATIVTLGRHGGAAVYPVVETVQRDHICHLVRAPAAVPAAVSERAAEFARRAVEAIGAVGSFGVEMFLLGDGSILLNELAPRVHNSGHYTIQACECSQFENHVRAVLGWPLGSTRMLAPAAVMVNLLGAGPGPGQPAGLQQALAVPGAHVHIYGKRHSARGRKMGHVTALGASLAAAEDVAQRSALAITFGTKA